MCEHLVDPSRVFFYPPPKHELRLGSASLCRTYLTDQLGKEAADALLKNKAKLQKRLEIANVGDVFLVRLYEQEQTKTLKQRIAAWINQNPHLSALAVALLTVAGVSILQGTDELSWPSILAAFAVPFAAVEGILWANTA